MCSLYIVRLCRYRVTVTRDGGSFEQTVTFRTRGASMLYVFVLVYLPACQIF